MGRIAGIAAAAAASMTLMACYGGPIARQEAFSPCTNDALHLCQDSTKCAETQISQGTHICTADCTTDSDCPTPSTGAPAGVCIRQSGRGQCMRPCQTENDCGPFLGMSCKEAFTSTTNATRKVCVPDQPGVRAPYSACSTPGAFECGMGTECTTASFTPSSAGSTFPPDRLHCSRGCRTDGDCPYNGACIGATSSAEGQCFMPCVPENGTSQDRCASVNSTARPFSCITPRGTSREVCAPSALAP